MRVERHFVVGRVFVFETEQKDSLVAYGELGPFVL